MLSVAEDLRVGLRMLRKNPGFASVAVMTFGLGIAANTTVFSWMDAVLLRPLPGVADPRGLVALEAVSPEGDHTPCTHPDFRDFQRNLTLVSGVVAGHFTGFMIGQEHDAQHLLGQVVSANFFAVLGVKPAVGRMFSPDEDRDAPGAYPIAVISHRLWRSRYHADPSVVGRQVRLNGRQITIVGVAPANFHGSMGGVSLDVWVPLSMILEMGGLNTWAAADRNARFLDVIARLRPGVSIAQARAELRPIAEHIARTYPQTHSGVTATLVPLWQAKAGAQSFLLNPLRILMAVCVLVLLIACANVANLLLARSVSRQKEFGVRLAMGAGRARLVQQLVIEALLLSGAGAACGIWLAQWAGDGLVYLLPVTHLTREVFEPLAGQVSHRILAFTVFACVAAAVLSVVMPALYATRIQVNETLREGGRSGTSGARSHRARELLVVFEVALTTVALVGAGLFLRSFRNASLLHPGFDARNVLVANFYLSASGYSRRQEKQFDRSLRDRLATAPGIEQVSYADWVPLWFGESPWETLHIEGYSPVTAAGSKVNRTLVAPGYFSLMRIPLVAGRDFTDQDDADARPVLIVNEAFARRFFQGRDPIGRQVRIEGCCGRPWSVIGVVQNSKQNNPAEAPFPYFYAPFQQMFGTGHNNFLYIRAAGDVHAARTALRREAAGLNAGGLYDAMPLAEYTQASLYPQRVAAMLLVALGTLSLLLAAIGLYSVMAYAVNERTKEIGIRMALGAQSGDVLGMVLRRALILTAGGLLVGVPTALALTRLIASLLVQVSANDPLTVAVAALFLSAVAALASYLPARHATKVDPTTALRS
ncbi:MAG TPA: ABC transporter permease [Bryobacteraceae bacterium]|nr:ABC transporter permease [Bryobacteraceae bacterium]